MTTMPVASNNNNDNGNENNEVNEQQGEEEQPARTYEITATDHINKNMLGMLLYFKQHLQNNNQVKLLMIKYQC